ncbi:MAG: hypothetical protein K6C32_03290 [Bacilli bacterium]|nr:hypothetical protein [Bacilli bacterium]
MKIRNIIATITYILFGIAMIPIALFVVEKNVIIALTSLLLAVAVAISSITHKGKFNYVIYTLSLLFFVVASLPLIFRDGKLTTDTFCIIFGSSECVSGLVKIIEAVHLFNIKDKMAVPFLLDSLFEIVLGVLMIIELEESVRSHVILIGIETMYEGTIKCIHFNLKHHE